MNRRQAWLLFAILLIALYLRLVSIGFGLPALNDPDELMFEMGALRMLRGPTLDPGWFGHPATTTMYLLALINVSVFAFTYLFGWAASPRAFGDLIYADPSWFILPGRIGMTLFALASIYLTFRLAGRFFGIRAGLVAAVLLAVNPIHVTYSQIIRSDMMACVFMLLCLQSAIAIAERGSWRAYLTTAIWLALAVATKWPFALSGLTIGAATVIAVQNNVLSRRRALFRLAGASVAAIIVLFVVSPYLLIDFHIVLKNLQGEGQAHHLGATGGSVWQNAWWYASGPILAGFGAIGIVLLVIGARSLLRHRLPLMILMPVTLAFVIVLCMQQLIWERWALPLMPIGAIVAALGLETIVSAVRLRFTDRIVPWAIIAIMAAALAPLFVRIASDNRMRLNDTRQAASTWARQHIPRGSTVLVEHFAFDLIGQPWRFLFPMGNAGCIDVLAFLHGKIGYGPIEQARGDRSNLDYGTVAKAQRANCRADFAILTQAGRYRAERGVFPFEYSAYRSLEKSGRVVEIFRSSEGRIGGPEVEILDLRRNP